jgi:sulfotransferase family protein
MEVNMRLPTFLGIGMGRSGTRWLVECLAEHPQVFTYRSEVYFFSQRNYIDTNSQGIDWYKSLFDDSNPKIKHWGEITPTYIFERTSPELIKKHIPDVKIICTIREQVETLYSLYRLQLLQNYPQLFFTNYSFETHLRVSWIIEAGFYLEGLSRYMSSFPKENILILLYDDLVTDNEAYLKKVWDFLDVDSSFRPSVLDKRINTSNVIKAPLSLELARLSNNLSQSRYTRLGRRILNRINVQNVKRSNFPERHKILPEIKHRLATIYSEHNKQLGEFLQRDLSHWNT